MKKDFDINNYYIGELRKITKVDYKNALLETKHDSYSVFYKKDGITYRNLEDNIDYYEFSIIDNDVIVDINSLIPLKDLLDSYHIDYKKGMSRKRLLNCSNYFINNIK